MTQEEVQREKRNQLGRKIVFDAADKKRETNKKSLHFLATN